MKQNHYHFSIIGVFLFFIGGMLCLNLFTEDKAFSPTENRYLAQFPEITAETISSGDFMEEAETYVTDQFVARDTWVAFKSLMERTLGKQENNNVFFGSKDTLINRLDTPDPETMSTNASHVNKLATNLEAMGVPLYMGLIPSASTIWADRLPAHANTANETEIIGNFYGALTSNVTTLPLISSLLAQKEEDLYYRTDHHWTSRGAYYGYATLLESMGRTPVSLDSYTETVVSDQFYGTIYSSSGVRWVHPDSISTFVPEDNLTITSNFTGIPEEGSLYVPKFLEEKDKYSYFLGGIQPLCIIETEHTDAPSVLIIRDSYSDCLAPFLTQHFSEIHLLDLRFYNSTVAGYVESNQIDEVVVLYSLTNFASDMHLFKLGM